MLRLELLRQGQRPLVVRARAHVAVQVGHGLDVVVEHVRRIRGQDRKRALHAALAAEIGVRISMRMPGEVARVSDAVDEMLGAAVAQVIAVDAGDHHVLQAHVGDRSRHLAWLAGIGGLGPTVGDIAEAAAARADVAEDHEGRGAVAEALVDVPGSWRLRRR